MSLLPETAAKIVAWVTYHTTFIQQLLAWATGTATGGPNGDGQYPFTTYDGVTELIPCLALGGRQTINQYVVNSPPAPANFALSFEGQPGSLEVISFIVTPDPIVIPVNMANSAGRTYVNPLANRVFALKVGGTPQSGSDGETVATVTIQPSGVWGFDTTDGEVTIPGGSLIKLVAPVEVDGALTGVFLFVRASVDGFNVAELCPDPRANDPAKWVKSSNVAVTGGTVNFNTATSNSGACPDVVLEQGRTYSVRFQVRNYVGGGFYVRELPESETNPISASIGPVIHPLGSNARITADGYYEFNFTATQNCRIDFRTAGAASGGGFIWSIDNVSIKEAAA